MSALKAIYKAVPFKKQIFSAVKSVWVPPMNIYRHLHFEGAYRFQIDKDRSCILYANHRQFENELFWAGFKDSWEQYSLPIWVKLCEGAEVVFDIGAQSGIYSMLTKAVSPKCEIHAFEPTDVFYKALKRHCELNNFDIHCHKMAASNVDGFNHVENVWQDDKNVATIKLDTFIKQNNIKKIDLLKVDVDFHEIEVAEGFRELFHKYQPTVLIEVLSDAIAQGIEKSWNVQALGYLIFSIEEETGIIKQLPDMTKRDLGMNFLLCKPDVAKRIGFLS